MRWILWCGAIVGGCLALAPLVVSQTSTSPLGSRSIAFVCGQRGGGLGVEHQRICVWDGAGAGPRVLTHATDGGEDHLPVWSPDGSKIAYIHSVFVAGSNLRQRNELFVMDADGSHRRRIATQLSLPLSAAFEVPFAWAPDAKRIAVSIKLPAPPRRGKAPPITGLTLERDAAKARARTELYVIDVTTDRRRRVTRNHVFDGYPTWAGSRLVYARWLSNPISTAARRGARPRSEVRAFDSALRHDRRIRRIRGQVVALSAAPDGRRVAVIGYTDLSLVSVRTGHSTALLEGANGVVWSPDGRLIAAVLGSAARVVDPETGRIRLEASECNDPDFSLDGATLICTVGYGEGEEGRGGSDLFLVDPATGQRVRLTDTTAASDGGWRPASPGAAAPG